jgi:hypothetical protein
MAVFLPSVFLPIKYVSGGLLLLAADCYRRKNKVGSATVVNNKRSASLSKQHCCTSRSHNLSASDADLILDQAIDLFEVEEDATRVCTSCRHTRTKAGFSSRQWSKGNRECILCIELKPVVQALVATICAYCKRKQQELTKEHIVPKSFGGTYQPRICCRRCNQKRGNSLDFLPYLQLVRDYPVVRSHAHGSTPMFKNNLLTGYQQNAVINILKTANSTAVAQLGIKHFPAMAQ